MELYHTYIYLLIEHDYAILGIDYHIAASQKVQFITWLVTETNNTRLRCLSTTTMIGAITLQNICKHTSIT